MFFDRYSTDNQLCYEEFRKLNNSIPTEKKELLSNFVVCAGKVMQCKEYVFVKFRAAVADCGLLEPEFVKIFEAHFQSVYVKYIWVCTSDPGLTDEYRILYTETKLNKHIPDITEEEQQRRKLCTQARQNGLVCFKKMVKMLYHPVLKKSRKRKSNAVEEIEIDTTDETSNSAPPVQKVICTDLTNLDDIFNHELGSQQECSNKLYKVDLSLSYDDVMDIRNCLNNALFHYKKEMKENNGRRGKALMAFERVIPSSKKTEETDLDTEETDSE